MSQEQLSKMIADDAIEREVGLLRAKKDAALVGTKSSETKTISSGEVATYCTKCGQAFSAGDDFCPKCGTKRKTM